MYIYANDVVVVVVVVVAVAKMGLACTYLPLGEGAISNEQL